MNIRTPLGAVGLITIAVGAVIGSSAAAQEPVAYRDFTLRSSVASVVAITKTPESDVRVLHERPRLIQEITWRPRSMSGASLEPEVVREIRFQFLDDQLFSVLAAYDAYEVEGLTREDFVTALSAVYGSPSRSPSPEVVIAAWDRPGAQITLAASTYPSPYTVQLVEITLQASAKAAAAEDARLDKIEAPAREAEQRAREAEQRRLENAAARERNKPGFRP